MQTFLTLIPSIKAPERLPTGQMVVFYVNTEAKRLTPRACFVRQRKKDNEMEFFNKVIGKEKRIGDGCKFKG